MLHDLLIVMKGMAGAPHMAQCFMLLICIEKQRVLVRTRTLPKDMHFQATIFRQSIFNLRAVVQRAAWCAGAFQGRGRCTSSGPMERVPC